MGNAGYFSYLSSDWDMTINTSILVLKDSSHSRRGKMWLYEKLLGIPVPVGNLQNV